MSSSARSGDRGPECRNRAGVSAARGARDYLRAAHDTDRGLRPSVAALGAIPAQGAGLRRPALRLPSAPRCPGRAVRKATSPMRSYAYRRAIDPRRRKGSRLWPTARGRRSTRSSEIHGRRAASSRPHPPGSASACCSSSRRTTASASALAVALDRARPRRRRRRRRLRRGDGGGGGAPPAGPDRLPDAQDAHPRVDLVAAPLPDRAPGPEGRPRPFVARLGDRARRGGVGRHGARGDRRGRRRRRLGDAARSAMREAGKSSLYRHEVRRAAVEAVVEAVTQGRRRRRGARAAGLRRPARDRPPAAADDAGPFGRSTGGGPDGHGRAQDPRRRGPSRRARHDRGHRVPPVRRPPRAGRCAAAPGELLAQRARRDLPGHRRRRRVDHPPQAPPAGGRVFKLPATRALALAGHALRVPELPAPLHAPIAGRPHVPRDRLRGARPASATCTSTSTTAR